MSDAPVIWMKWVARTVLACLAVAAIGVLMVSVSRARQAAHRTTSQNNLKQLFFALANYHGTHLVLPPGGTFKNDGTGQHGWGVAIWPYVEGNPWYNRIDFNRAWNDAEGENPGLVRFRHALFFNPSVTTEVNEKEFGIAHYSANAHLMSANSFVSLTKLKDTTKVFLVGELAGDFVPWGCPYNWRRLGERLNADPPIYGRPTRDGAFFGMADGTVQFVVNDVDQRILDVLRGPDLAEFDKVGRAIVRPKAFAYPRNALQPSMENFGLGKLPLGWRDYDLKLVKLNLWGFGKGETWTASNEEFTELRRYRDLRQLEAKGTFTDTALTEMPKIEHLESLRLQSDFITEAGLRQLDKQPRLKSLAISGKQITPEVVERLQRHLPNCDIQKVKSRDN